MRAFDVGLRSPVDAATLRAAAARVLGVDASDFAEGPSSSERGLWLDVFDVPGGIRTIARFFVDEGRVVVPSTFEVARSLAADLETDAVIGADSDGAPPDVNGWLLIRPSGELFEAFDDGEEGLTLDERPGRLRSLGVAR